MYAWLRTIFFCSLILTLALIPVTSSAQHRDWNSAQTDDEEENEDYQWKTWRTQRSHGGFNGFGGFYFNAQTFESDHLDNLAAAMDLKEFDSFIPTWGGWGMGHVGGGWRLGGGGHGGEMVTDGVYTATDGTKYNRTLEVDLGMGGFMFEYSPWMFGPVNFGLGAMVGGGGISVIMSQDTGTYTWEDLNSQYVGDPSDGENIRTQIDQGFFIAEPYVTVRVHILDWMALSGSAGYTITSFKTSEWEFNEDHLTGDGPDIDLNKPFYRVGLVFGG
ncbi:MAG TPA: hypothetical protein ENH10_01835 [Bacteroidetes bacterium]|nr:hypothetical protein BMS3Bbin04_01203 [bacterium BMS3Bbin04]HDO64758.1 hypothetical protein [Bacteroidota bacterium]HEX03883.1 hypothetical protein [Bacteroidota bacterium]